MAMPAIFFLGAPLLAEALAAPDSPILEIVGPATRFMDVVLANSDLMKVTGEGSLEMNHQLGALDIAVVLALHAPGTFGGAWWLHARSARTGRDCTIPWSLALVLSMLLYVLGWIVTDRIAGGVARIVAGM